MIEKLRKQKLRELQNLKNARFGRVYPIGRDDYTRDVTEASEVDSTEENAAGRGTGVVCFLYKDGQVLLPLITGINIDHYSFIVAFLAVTEHLTKYVHLLRNIRIPNLSPLLATSASPTSRNHEYLCSSFTAKERS